jgi:hypothetical protein
MLAIAKKIVVLKSKEFFLISAKFGDTRRTRARGVQSRRQILISISG